MALFKTAINHLKGLKLSVIYQARRELLYYGRTEVSSGIKSHQARQLFQNHFNFAGGIPYGAVCLSTSTPVKLAYIPSALE